MDLEIVAGIDKWELGDWGKKKKNDIQKEALCSGIVVAVVVQIVRINTKTRTTVLDFVAC